MCWILGSNNASIVLFPKNKMYFRNSFSKNSDLLTIHCRSKKDDLGIHMFLCIVLNYLVGLNLIVCYSKTFTAYKQTPYFMRFGAKDDGIYLTNDAHEAKFI
ncbi:hypothetical protein CARUB_v10016460mg [Capsella rubella]|uniref:Uncharacterized protein n=1 Tax=Capsella rubella TaxID=81985 RepID=R0GBL5_9BRAS|nr:hypothetical protein CARUB_v10016460mg [Capsella rubella]